MILPWIIFSFLIVFGILLIVLPVVLGPSEPATPDPTFVFPTPLPVPTPNPDLAVKYSRFLYVPIFTSPGTLSVIDTQTNQLVASNVSLGPAHIADGSRFALLSFDEKTLYVTNYQGDSITVVNTVTLSIVEIIKLADYRTNLEMTKPDGACLSIDGTLLYVACNGTLISAPSGGIAIFSTINNSFVEFIPGNSQLNGPSDLILNFNGDKMYISNYFEQPSRVSIMSLPDQSISTTGFKLSNIGQNTQFLSKISANPDNQYIYGIPPFPTSQTLSLYVMFTNTVTPTTITSKPLANTSYQTCVSPDGNRVFAINSVFGGGSFGVFDVTDRKDPIRGVTIAIPGSFAPLGITCNFSYIYTTSTNNNGVSIFDIDTYALVATLPVGNSGGFMNNLRMVGFP